MISWTPWTVTIAGFLVLGVAWAADAFVDVWKHGIARGSPFACWLVARGDGNDTALMRLMVGTVSSAASVLFVALFLLVSPLLLLLVPWAIVRAFFLWILKKGDERIKNYAHRPRV